MMDRRNQRIVQGRVTEGDIQEWVEEERTAEGRSRELALAELEAARHMAKTLVLPHGDLATERTNGTFRGLYVQLNGMRTNKIRNRKAAILQSLCRRYDIGIASFAEVGVNRSRSKHKKRLLTLLPDLSQSACCSTSHNRHDRSGAIKQQGGTGILVLGDLIQFYRKGRKDFRGLGRWDSCLLQDSPGHRTRYVQGYAVIDRFTPHLDSIYQQSVVYKQEHNIVGATPRQLFVHDLLWQLRVWRATGDRIILCMDANEHVLMGPLCRQLTSQGIDLQEATKARLGSLCPHTYVDGRIPIDGVWTTPDIEITGITWLPFDESPGDHRACVFEFIALSTVGVKEKKISYPACRRLTTQAKGCMEKYAAVLEEQWCRHRMEERLDSLQSAAAGSFPAPPHIQRALDILNAQTVELQTFGEKHCRTIYRPDFPATPDSSLWHKRHQIIGQLICYHEGSGSNFGNLCRKARRLGISIPHRLSLAQLYDNQLTCTMMKRQLKSAGPILRLEFLQERLLEAEGREDKDSAKAIRAIMEREGLSTMWREIKFATNDSAGRSTSVLCRSWRLKVGVLSFRFYYLFSILREPEIS
jgi:hypothetical protein